MMKLDHVVVLFGFFILLACPVWAQGPLTPPGAPEPTMRTLLQVEPRTPITNAPYVITQPGSYYLAGNLSSTGVGIVVQANGVTLDLMGFTLSGTVAPGSVGVLVSNTSPVRGFALRNGFIMRFEKGIAAYNAMNGYYEKLMMVSNGFAGISMVALPGGKLLNNVLRDITLTESFVYGIQFVNLGGDIMANTLRDNTVYGSDTGILFSDNGGSFNFGNIIIGNTVIDSSDVGISIRGARNRIENNHVYSTTTEFLQTGFSSSGAGGNIIFNNFSAGYAFPFVLGTNDMYGPLVTTNGALSATGAQSHPKANFTR